MVKYMVKHAVSGLPVVYERIQLGQPPLKLVLCQLRFSLSPSLATDEGADALQRALAERDGSFSVLEPERTEGRHITLEHGGVKVEQTEHVSYRLEDPTSHWWIRFDGQSATLVGNSYDSRWDFLDILDRLQEALASGFVTAFTRISVRYVSLVDERWILDDLPRYVRLDTLGGYGIPDTFPDVEISATLSTTQLNCGPLAATIRTGLAPPGHLPDPSLEPLKRRGWLLDIDVVDNKAATLIADDVRERAHALTETQYQLFRWVVTEDFLTHYGATR